LRNLFRAAGLWLATYPASSYWLKTCQMAARNRGQFPGELGVTLCFVGKHDQFFLNKVVERALSAEASLDSSRPPTLRDPDLLESHSESI